MGKLLWSGKDDYDRSEMAASEGYMNAIGFAPSAGPAMVRCFKRAVLGDWQQYRSPGIGVKLGPNAVYEQLTPTGNRSSQSPP